MYMYDWTGRCKHFETGVLQWSEFILTNSGFRRWMVLECHTLLFLQLLH